LNRQHRGDLVDEKTRIEELGGWLTVEEELDVGRLQRLDVSLASQVSTSHITSMSIVHRVCGDQQTTRGFGDSIYKRFVPGEPLPPKSMQKMCFDGWPEGHDESFRGDLVVAEPEVETVQLQRGDEFVIMGTDGIWDVMTVDEAVEIVRDCKGERGSASEAAQMVVERALSWGSNDNISVIVIFLMW